ncbi:MAG: aquaporin [Thermoguttaceae bacterium]|nr:aquaporin [Thermoguttaceae bacterium]
MKKYFAELIGTFVLTFVGCGVAAMTGCNGADANGAYVATALAFGLTIVAMAYSIGNVSGCHINPAVSLGVLINKGMSVKDFVGYVIAQCCGATIAGAALLALIGTEKGLGCNALFEGDVAKSLIIEAILTFIFVLSILGVTSKAEFGKVAGLVIGGSLTLVHLMGIAFTGTSVNPARSLGPALMLRGDALSCVWVFWVGPLVGAAVAALVWRALSTKKED